MCCPHTQKVNNICVITYPYVCMYVYFSFTCGTSAKSIFLPPGGINYFSAYFPQNDNRDIKIENKVTQLHPATVMLFRFCSDVSH